LRESALLCGAPPAATLAWAAAAVSPSSRVARVRSLAGFSSAVHALLVLDRRQVAHELVLRRFVRREWLRREPDLAEREARVLEFLESTAVPAPRLIAVDVRGDRADVPAVLMSRVDGTPRRRPRDRDAYVGLLAEALAGVHAQPLPDSGMLRRYRPYNLHLRLGVPRWASTASAWERALKLYSGPAPEPADAVLLHRDYHPGNVLWNHGNVSGVVDWVNASIGCAHADVGHCRMVLALSWGQEWADRFLGAYRAHSATCPHGYDPYWDVAAGVGAIPDVPLTATQAARLDRFVDRAVHQRA
jgi:aminoglycoside phosphotransferase (APT) family kinase protein